MSKPRTYKRVGPGEWQQPVKRGYLMACCDCCLVHRFDFRVKNGRVQLRAWREPQKTVALRKREGVVLNKLG